MSVNGRRGTKSVIMN